MLRGIENKLRKRLGAAPAVAGEGPHLPMTNYCGPKTNLEHKDRYGPVSGKHNGLDRVCQQHDYSYADAEGVQDPRKKFELIQMADAEMVRQIQNLPPEQRGFFAKFAKFIINKQHQIEGQLGTPVYGGLPLGAQPVITVNKPRKQNTGVRASLSETMKPARKTLQELKQYILANTPVATQTNVFFKQFMDDLDKSTNGLEQTLSLMPEDQIMKFVNSAVYSKNEMFLGNLEKKKTDLEASKHKLLNSAKYRAEKTEVKKRIVDEMNKKIEGVNQQLSKANAGFSMLDKSSAPVSKMTEKQFSSTPLWEAYDEAEGLYKESQQLLKELKSKHTAKEGTYEKILKDMGPEKYEKFKDIFGDPTSRDGNKYNKWLKQLSSLKKTMDEADKELTGSDGKKYARNAIVQEVEGDGEIDIDDYIDKLSTTDVTMYKDPKLPGISYSKPEDVPGRVTFFDPHHDRAVKVVPDDNTVLNDFAEWLKHQPSTIIHGIEDEEEEDQKPVVGSGRKYLKAKPLSSKKKAALLLALPKKPRKKTISA